MCHKLHRGSVMLRSEAWCRRVLLRPCARDQVWPWGRPLWGPVRWVPAAASAGPTLEAPVMARTDGGPCARTAAAPGGQRTRSLPNTHAPRGQAGRWRRWHLHHLVPPRGPPTTQGQTAAAPAAGQAPRRCGHQRLCRLLCRACPSLLCWCCGARPPRRTGRRSRAWWRRRLQLGGLSQEPRAAPARLVPPAAAPRTEDPLCCRWPLPWPPPSRGQPLAPCLPGCPCLQRRPRASGAPSSRLAGCLAPPPRPRASWAGAARRSRPPAAWAGGPLTGCRHSPSLASSCRAPAAAPVAPPVVV
mmetsp:Transcript_117864/g.380389  ORF Transcript_117864/g.380389 Transcript_117864/m.380389 type:complete len:301 (-) Transcript_117864:228-1130(-)